MKKLTTLLLTGLLISSLLAGCGGSSTGSESSSSNAAKSKETEAVQDSNQTEADSEKDSEQTEADSEKDSEQTEADSEKDSEQTEADSEKDSEEKETAPVSKSDQQETGTEAASHKEAQTATSQNAEKEAEHTDPPTNFALIRKTITDAEGNIVNETIWDEAGDTICNKIQYLAGDVQTYYYMLTDKEYDEKGLWSGSSVYFFNADDIGLEEMDAYKTEENKTATEVCTYSEGGYEVERTNADGSPNFKYTYDKDGRRIRESFFLSDQDSWRIIDKKYDEQGVLTESVCETPNYEFKTENTVIGSTPVQTLYSVGKDGDHDDILELEYDENGKLVKGTETSHDNKKTEYTFELDEYGNLIRSTSTDSDGNVRITEYELLPLYE